jgi:hypothetical protein
MILVRILVNALLMAGEIAAALAVAWLGYRQPIVFAALTAAVAAWLGVKLEYDRIRFEFPFYFERLPALGRIAAGLMACVEAGFRALLAGLVALLTFSGTEPGRLYWVAVIFAVCVWAGSTILRRLWISLSARPSRWGYFRLAAPLGLLFSAALTFLPVPSLADVGRRLIFDLPAKPSVTQASEALFVVKQKFDELVVALLSVPLGPEAGRIVGVLVSVNVLTGFVIALYALLIAEAVRRVEERGI